MTVYIAIGIILIWYILSNFNISLTGKLANIFFFSMVVISLIVSVTFFTSGSWSFQISLTMVDFSQWVEKVSLLRWQFFVKIHWFRNDSTLIEKQIFQLKIFGRLYYQLYLFLQYYILL